MIDYIFFHAQPCQLFCGYLQNVEVAFKKSHDETDVEATVISISDDLDDDLSDKIEAYYDELLEMDESLLVEDPNELIDQAGLAVTLKNGESSFASINPDVLNRMLTVVTRDEIAEFIDDVVNAVENPDQRAICKRFLE